jgi:hypothetical protein
MVWLIGGSAIMFGVVMMFHAFQQRAPAAAA